MWRCDVTDVYFTVKLLSLFDADENLISKFREAIKGKLHCFDLEKLLARNICLTSLPRAKPKDKMEFPA